MPSYIVRGDSPTRIHLVFSDPAANNSALIDPTSYALTDDDGSPLTVLSVTVVASAQIRSVSLTLDPGTPIAPLLAYHLTLSGAVLTTSAAPYTPALQTFVWPGQLRSAVVPSSRFTGEVSGGLYGISSGLLFFSPALTTPTANSAIELTMASACTRAYDVYQLPPQITQNTILHTFGPPIPLTYLNQAVLYGPLGIAAEAQVVVRDLRNDAYAGAIDNTFAQATLNELFDPNYVAYLNNPFYTLNGNGSLGTFITANIAGPIPPGTTVVIPLQP